MPLPGRTSTLDSGVVWGGKIMICPCLFTMISLPDSIFLIIQCSGYKRTSKPSDQGKVCSLLCVLTVHAGTQRTRMRVKVGQPGVNQWTLHLRFFLSAGSSTRDDFLTPSTPPRYQPSTCNLRSCALRSCLSSYFLDRFRQTF